MNSSVVHPVPDTRAVVLAQLRAVAFTMRGPVLAAAVVAGLATLFVGLQVARGEEVVSFRPWEWLIPGVAGLLLPVGIWRGEDRFGAGFLWTLPVERRRHALIRVLAGWVWLMGAAAFAVVWLLAFAAVAGGSILAEETVALLANVPAGGEPVEFVPWRPDPRLWLVPFTSATAAYLVGSAIALGPRSPVRWLIAVVLLVLLVGGLGEALGSEWLIFAPSRALSWFVDGRYGVYTLLTARQDLVEAAVVLSDGELVRARRSLPDVGAWLVATLLWTAAGGAALWAASLRHRERVPARRRTLPHA